MSENAHSLPDRWRLRNTGEEVGVDIVPADGEWSQHYDSTVVIGVPARHVHWGDQAQSAAFVRACNEEVLRRLNAYKPMLEALEVAEWSVLEPMGDDSIVRRCPVCYRAYDAGHAIVCKLAAAIREGEKAHGN